MQEQHNVSTEMEILRKNQKRNARDKKILTKMKNAFDGLISRQDINEERLSDIQHISIESLKITKQKEQRLEKNIQGLWDIYKMCNMCIMGIPEQEREKRTKKYLKQ